MQHDNINQNEENITEKRETYCDRFPEMWFHYYATRNDISMVTNTSVN
jgi:hypothetical protein